MAVQNNIDYTAEKLDIDIAKNNIKAANRLQNPDFNVFYNLGKAGSGNPQQIGLSETIEIAKRGARKKLAKSNLELTKENVSYYEFDLKMDVREAYVNLVAAKSILNSLKQQQQLLEELVAIAKKRVAAGAAPEMDVIQAEIALNQMITQVNTAKVNVKSASFDFNKVINPKDKTDIIFDSADDLFNDKKNFTGLLTPEPESELPQFDTIAENTLKNRFDIRIAKQQIDVAKKNLTVVARQRIPDLAVLGGYGYQSKGMSDDGTFQNGAYAGASLVNIPLFYSYRPEIKNAKLEVEKAGLNYNSTRNKALKDLNNAYEKFLTAKLNLNYYNNKLLKSSEEMIKLSKRSYEVGKSNLTTLIVMEQSYKSIIVGYTYALAEYYNCWIDFLREVNSEELKFNDEAV
ncbi:TPA: TolC family protein [Candidatus Scatousia excrementigallinarum]|uniref:TolC family protein n=1 Tax=Candidatus Scatousia excrementigallinarum TaxID=2840935 RepID=A0A9D1F0W1_9BACT|nr:TolC family protein [Candidatus Scatousia excrementigallinarum]